VVGEINAMSEEISFLRRFPRPSGPMYPYIS